MEIDIIQKMTSGTHRKKSSARRTVRLALETKTADTAVGMNQAAMVRIEGVAVQMEAAQGIVTHHRIEDLTTTKGVTRPASYLPNALEPVQPVPAFIVSIKTYSTRQKT